LDEFKEDFRVMRGESILKKYLETSSCKDFPKLFVAIHIAQKRLMDTDKYIDDPDLENLVSD
jgi:hypothetical protein